MNLPPTVSTPDLTQHIDQDLQTCDNLLQLLKAERQALDERNFALLEEIIYQKSTALQSLENSANQRAVWLRDNPAGATDTPLEDQWTQLLDQAAPQLVARWETLRTRLAECQATNDVNGRILSRKQATYAQLLKVMRGQTESANLYSPKGSAGSRPPGQPLGSA